MADNPANSPRILIIIVTWNKQQYVLNLLASLQQLDYPFELLDIVVVDNASSDGTVAAIRAQYPRVHLICNAENVGGTGGFNTGLQYAFNQPIEKYEYLWLLDNDVVVHRRALTELVTILNTKSDIAIAGSTMLQLDYPYRINEMGAYVQMETGHLILNRHFEEIPAWRGKSIDELLNTAADLTQILTHCRTYLDVDYVAAASLLIRSRVAREAGLWRDYFIHFDDVEWCLRIGKSGHRVVASAKSLIWHLSAAAKIPTWVLYYDNRNLLDMLQTHGANVATLRSIKRYIRKKSLYYHLIGKSDLAQLHEDALDDFAAGRLGKKNIQLTSTYLSNQKISQVLSDPQVKRVLLPWTVNLQATGIQESIVIALQQRTDLKVDYLYAGHIGKIYQLPRPHFLPPLPRFGLARLWYYWGLRGRYDVVFQSDYQRIIPLSWVAQEIVFINDDSFSRQSAPRVATLWRAVKSFVSNYFGT